MRLRSLAAALVAAVTLSTVPLGAAASADPAPSPAADRTPATVSTDHRGLAVTVEPAYRGEVRTSTRELLADAGLRDQTRRGTGRDSLATAAAAPLVAADTDEFVPGLTRHVTPSCTGTGTDGKRVQVVYAREVDQADRYSAVLPVILNEIQTIDDTFAVSAKKTGGGKKVRWVHGNCTPVVHNLALPDGSLSGFDATVNAMKAANPAAYGRTDRKYLVFTDTISGLPGGACGLAQYAPNDTAPTGNYNDNGGMFARVNSQCWVRSPGHGSYAAHELMHMFGAVLSEAPNASSYGHCDDEGDAMCYPDGTSNMPMRDVCPVDPHGDLFDCNGDDYFNTNPAAGSYLATHWNTANSAFLDTTAALPDPPAVTVSRSRATAETGDDVVFTATTSASSLTWDVTTDECIKSASGKTLTLNCPYFAAGTQGVTARVSNGDGVSGSASNSVAVTAASAPSLDLTAPDRLFATQAYTQTVTVTGGKAPLAIKWTNLTPECTASTGETGTTYTITCPNSMVDDYATTEVAVSTGDGRQVTERTDRWVEATPPSVTINAPSSIVSGTTQTVTATVSNAGTSPTYQWQSSRGWISGSASGTSVTVAPPAGATGTDTLTLTVFTADGRVATASTTYNSATGLGVSIYGPDTLAMNSSTTLTASANEPATITWATATGSCTVTGNATATLTCGSNFTGQITVTATATATGDGKSVTATRTINVVDPSMVGPDLSLDLPGSGASGLAYTASASNRGSQVTSWAWSVSHGCGVGASNERDMRIQCPLHVSGNITVSVTGTSSNGQSQTVSKNIAINPRGVAFEVGGPNPRIAPGQPTSVVGRVKDALSGGTLRADVALESSIDGQHWGTLAYAGLVSTGEVSAAVAPTRTTYYRVRAAGGGVSAAYAIIVVAPTPTPTPPPTTPTPTPTGKSASALTLAAKGSTATKKFIGKAKTTSGAAISGATLALQVKWKGTAKFTTVKKGTTSGTGKTVVKFKMSKKVGDFRFTWGGNAAYTGSTSAAKKVKR